MKKMLGVLLFSAAATGAWKQDKFMIGTWHGPALTGTNATTDRAALQKLANAHFNLLHSAGGGYSGAYHTHTTGEFYTYGGGTITDSYTYTHSTGIKTLNFVKGATIIDTTPTANMATNAWVIDQVDAVNQSRGKLDLQILVSERCLPGASMPGLCWFGSSVPSYLPANLGAKAQTVFGYNFFDEPSIPVHDTLPHPLDTGLARMAATRAADTGRAMMGNLGVIWVIQPPGTFGQKWQIYDEDYVTKYFNHPGTTVATFDYYALTDDNHIGTVRYNWAGGAQMHLYKVLGLFGERSKETGKPFWGVPNASEYSTFQADTATGQITANTLFPYPTDAILRFNVFSNLVYGAKGLLWFDYAGGDGAPGCPSGYFEACEDYSAAAESDTVIYDLVKAVNLEVKNMGSFLMSSKWIATIHGAATDPLSGEPDLPVVEANTPILTSDIALDGDAAVGIFSVQDSANKYRLMVFNKDFNNYKSVYFSVRGCPEAVYMDKPTGDWYGAYIACYAGYAMIGVGLPAGDIALLTLSYPTPAKRLDYDADGKADLSSFDGGGWRIDYAGNNFDPYGTPDFYTYAYASTPVATPGDYDGDGLMDMGYKTPSGDWVIDFGYNGFSAPIKDEVYLNYPAWANDSCKPVPRDYDGDHKTDIAVFCNDAPTMGKWEIDYAANGFGVVDVSFNGGFNGDHHPMPADYDGDGKTDLGVKYDGYGGEFWINYAYNGYGSWDEVKTGWGDATYTGAPADFDGDGQADIAVMYNSGYTQWYIDYAANGYTNNYYDADEVHTPFGTVSMNPVPMDYDGDGKADIAGKSDYYESWHIDYSANGFGSQDAYFDGWGADYNKALQKPSAQAPTLRNHGGILSFSFDLKNASKVSVKAYDLDGKRISTLFEGGLGSGANNLSWSRRELSEKGLKRGMYFLRLETGEYKASKRLALTD